MNKLLNTCFALLLCVVASGQQAVRFTGQPGAIPVSVSGGSIASTSNLLAGDGAGAAVSAGIAAANVVTQSANGTSGGVPCYTAANKALVSSSAGVAGAMMAWGGAGACPTSPLSLLVTNQNSATETWTFYNSTASTGKTRINFREGAGGAASDPYFLFYRNDGTTVLGGAYRSKYSDTIVAGFQGVVIGPTGQDGSDILNSTGVVSIGQNQNGYTGILMNNSAYFCGSAASGLNGTVDTCLVRGAAGIWDVNSVGYASCTSSLSNCRDVLLRQAITKPATVSTLQTCNSGNKGARSFVTDATATTFLSTVSGGGANNVPVVCDGTNWVIG